MRKFLLRAVLLAALMSLASCACADECDFGDSGVRLELPASWQAVSADNAGDFSALLSSLGTSPEVFAASLQANGGLCEVLTPEGLQLSLSAAPAPQSLAGLDSFDDTALAALEDFLRADAPEAVLSPDPARHAVLCEERFSASSVDTAVRTRVFLHGGYVYRLSVTGYGAAVSASQEQALDELSDGLLFLGVKDAAQPEEVYPVLSDVPQNGDNAEVRYETATPITLDPVPSVLYGRTLTVTGVTEPGVSMRCYIGDVGYDRFTAAADGTFTSVLTFPDAGKQRVRVQAIGQAGYGTAAFSVTVKQVQVPAALAVTEAETRDDHYTLYGRTLPGASVKLYLRKQATEAQVAEDGTFRLNVPLDKDGVYKYTLRVTCEGWKKQDIPVTLTRSPDAPSTDPAASAVAPTDELLSSADLTDVVLRVSGEIVDLANPAGTPYLLVTPDGCEGQVAIAVDSLAAWHTGDRGEWLAALTGGSVTLTGWAEAPLARLLSDAP